MSLRLGSKLKGWVSRSKILLLGLAAFAGIWTLFNLRSRSDLIEIDGKTYEFVLYDVKSARLSFSRGDRNPKLLQTHPWLAAAVLTDGAAFMETLSEQELARFFEKPPENLKQRVSQLLAGADLKGEVTVESAEKYLIGGQWYLCVGLGRSDVPGGVTYVKLVEQDGRWVNASGARDPKGEVIREIRRISAEVHRRETAEKYKYVPVTRL